MPPRILLGRTSLFVIDWAVYSWAAAFTIRLSPLSLFRCAWSYLFVVSSVSDKAFLHIVHLSTEKLSSSWSTLHVQVAFPCPIAKPEPKKHGYDCGELLSKTHTSPTTHNSFLTQILSAVKRSSRSLESFATEGRENLLLVGKWKLEESDICGAGSTCNTCGIDWSFVADGLLTQIVSSDCIGEKNCECHQQSRSTFLKVDLLLEK